MIKFILHMIATCTMRGGQYDKVKFILITLFLLSYPLSGIITYIFIFFLGHSLVFEFGIHIVSFIGLIFLIVFIWMYKKFHLITRFIDKSKAKYDSQNKKYLYVIYYFILCFLSFILTFVFGATI